MDQDMEGMVRSCEECQTQQASPPHAPIHPWKWPTRPRAQLHVDFAGPMWGRMLLVVIDAHSKWIEVEDMKECHSRRYHSKVESNVCEIWYSKISGFRQWALLHQQRIQGFLKEEWGNAHHIRSVSPGLEWLGREGCEDYQERTTEDESRNDK